MDKQDDVDEGEEDEKGEEGPVVPPVVCREVVGEHLLELLRKGLFDGGLGGDQPLADANGKVLDEAVVALQLILQVVDGDGVAALLDGVLEHALGEVGYLLLVKVHPVLHHAGLHNLAQVALVNETVV